MRRQAKTRWMNCSVRLIEHRIITDNFDIMRRKQ